MKRNIIVILTLALECVLFVACGKEEVAPIDIAIGELQAARENIDNQIAALEAQRPATEGGSGATTFVNTATIGDSTVIPAGKTCEEMTETEREAYDRAKIAEFAEQAKNDPSIDVGDAVAGRLFNDMGCYIDEDGQIAPFHMPGLYALPEELQNHVGCLDNAVSYCRGRINVYQDVSREYLEEYFMEHPETIVQLVNLYYEVVDGDTSKEVGKIDDRIAEFLAIVPLPTTPLS